MLVVVVWAVGPVLSVMEGFFVVMAMMIVVSVVLALAVVVEVIVVVMVVVAEAGTNCDNYVGASSVL